MSRSSGEQVLYREGGRLWPIAATLALGTAACLALGASGGQDQAYGLAVGLGCVWLGGIAPYFVGQRLYSTVTVTTREERSRNVPGEERSRNVPGEERSRNVPGEERSRNVVPASTAPLALRRAPHR